ncbi:MAG TPA: HAD family hydrolase [Acidimicrobiales bacterium]|jgi:putative hydrolase of the HAD superfamily|nr:HAD family hydrolase [Acidimicrobiales bacterium]
MVEAVLFDGDQTLWDFQRVMQYALEQVLLELQAVRPGRLTTALSTRDLAAHRQQVVDEIGNEEFSWAELRQLGFARTVEQLREADNTTTLDDDAALVSILTASYFHHRDIDPALFPDTRPCLEALQSRYRLGLLSNGSRLPGTIGLGDVFDPVVFAQDHHIAKPDVGIFRIVESLMGLDPESLVLVGDHPLNDVVGAKRAGWRAVWIDRDGRGPFVAPAGFEHQPDAVITSLEQLPHALDRL